MSEKVIVVALDGSEVSEASLPYAEALAQATKSRLLLVTVWETGEELLAHQVPSLGEDAFKQGEVGFEQYVTGVAKRLQAEGLQVDAEVRVGNVVEELTALINDRGASMVVIASHGRSGLGRWIYGSTAAKLAREMPVPTLVVGPKCLERKDGAPSFQCLLVPLDGSDVSEAALPVAVELAEACSGEIVLAEVLQFASQAFMFGVPSVDVSTIDKELSEAAQDYLDDTKSKLTTNASVSTVVEHGEPSDKLIDLIAREHVDLVVMATHGRSGIIRTALGSVADRMLQSNAPVLLVRPPSS